MKRNEGINEAQMNNFNNSTTQQLNTSTSDGVAIRVEHVSKKYCKSLKRSMLYGVTDIGRNTLGLSSHSDNLRKHEFWAVDDVSFELKRGETLGIIGPNGSGKTTLLKMLNGIFWPDKGKISIKGRVGALIEVGAGFHPLLTGRENVYINAAILGMTKEEVDEKFDDIVEFADIGDFIDTPVKFYSSGMFVRLGFAVAVHCEPDILLVDEVLAVGDMVFQRKCLEKIGELKDQNIATIFISHNMQRIDGLCDRTIFLNCGRIKALGKTSEVIRTYESYVNEQIKLHHTQQNFGLSTDYSSKEMEITKVRFFDKDGNEKNTFFSDEKMVVRVTYFAPRRFEDPVFSFYISRSDGIVCCRERTKFHGTKIDFIEGEGVFEIEFEKIQLYSGIYTFGVVIFDSSITLPYVHRMQDTFRVESYTPHAADNQVFHPIIKWKIS